MLYILFLIFTTFPFLFPPKANIIGLVMWAYSDSKGLDMWIPGTVFIGLGEGLTFFACFYGANLLTKHKTLFVSLLSGLWNAGGLNMCIVQVLFLFNYHKRNVFLIPHLVPLFQIRDFQENFAHVHSIHHYRSVCDFNIILLYVPSKDFFSFFLLIYSSFHLYQCFVSIHFFPWFI